MNKEVECPFCRGIGKKFTTEISGVLNLKGEVLMQKEGKEKSTICSRCKGSGKIKVRERMSKHDRDITAFTYSETIKCPKCNDE